jgi:IgGFc binding protein
MNLNRMPHRFWMVLAAALALLGWAGHLASGQGPLCGTSHQGREFWLTFPGNFPDPLNPVRLNLNITGAPLTTGVVTIANVPEGIPFTIPGGATSLTMDLPTEADLGEANDVVESNGVHILASEPVGVVGVDQLPNSTDAFLGLPLEMLGTNYWILGYGNTHADVPELNGTQFAIVAGYDDTAVTIVPSVTTGSHALGAPYTLALNQGQTYQLRNTNGAPADLSGSWIRSDKPIGVFAGHRCATVPDDTVFFCNYLVEQLPPVSAWGTQYLAQPLGLSTNSQRLRVLAGTPGTAVTLLSSSRSSQSLILNQGQWAELPLVDPIMITAIQPVLVAQFTPSGTNPAGEESDATMTLVPSTDHYFAETLVSIPMPETSHHFLNLAVAGPLPQPPTISIDDNPVTLETLLEGAFYAGTVTVGAGTHHLVSDVPVGAIVSGSSFLDAYAYPGGFAISQSDSDGVTFQTPGRVIVSCLDGQGVPVPFQVEARSDCEEAVPVVCEPPSGSIFPLGDTQVVCSATNRTGEVFTTSFQVTVSCLMIKLGPGVVIITWNGSGALQAAETLSGKLSDWQDVPTTGNTYQQTLDVPRRFFRVKY